MQIKTFDSFHPDNLQVYNEIFNLTKSITETYPNYEKWYREKFLTGLKKGERVCLIAQDKEKNLLVGCALIKNTKEEKKICTFFVHPHYRRQGIGTQLMQKSLEVLGKRPLITVAEQNVFQLLPLLQKFGFHWSATKKTSHFKNAEIFFNDPKSDAIKEGLVPLLKKRIEQLKK